MNQAATTPPISARTGEPRRPWTVATAVLASYGALGWMLYCFVRYWWATSIADDPHASTRLARLLKPGEIVTFMGPLIVAVMFGLIAAFSLASAHFGWNGYRKSGLGSLIALALSPLTILLNPWAWITIPIIGVETLLLWLPPTRRYIQAQTARRSAENYVPPAPEPEHVDYGPLSRYQS